MKQLTKTRVEQVDTRFIIFLRKWRIPTARFALFLVFFWFGIIKLLGASPASQLAEALTVKTVGVEYFTVLFTLIALLECVIGLLFLFPRYIRIVIPLLLLHMAIVCSPLLLTPEYTWQAFLVPTLEGQYIIKNAVVVALALGIAASATPLTKK